MYTIYINEVPLHLVSAKKGKKLMPGTKKNIVAKYLGRRQTLFPYIDTLEKANSYKSMTIFYHDVEQLMNDFCKIYKVKEASGGVVFNAKGEILMIYRLKFWDLPKGKIEQGETKEEAAIREVQEETGIKDVTIHDYLTTTYHTFINRSGKRALKIAHWYLMSSTDTKLIPQAEEDIEEAVWITKADFLKSGKKAYKNILTVLDLV